MPFGQWERKGRRYPVEILSAEEIRALIAATSRRGFCGARDRAMIAMLYRGGLRIAEALALYAKDVDLGGGAVRVLDGKGGKARVVGIDDEAVALLEVWMSRRGELGLNGRSPLFCTLAGGAMSDVQVRQHLKALAVKAGIEKRVHPHGLRHARAVNLLQNGADVKTIQMALGHANLGTTDTYLAHIAPADVIAAMRGGAW